MLQRIAEDMEFSECREWSPVFFCGCRFTDFGSLIVDAAAAEVDPHRRIAFVAAFAMSNYSSTIGRIAKPFNPMLVCVLPCWSCLHDHTKLIVSFDRARRLSTST